MGIRNMIKYAMADFDSRNGKIIDNPPDKLDDLIFKMLCLEKQLDNMHSRLDNIEEMLRIRAKP